MRKQHTKHHLLLLTPTTLSVLSFPFNTKGSTRSLSKSATTSRRTVCLLLSGPVLERVCSRLMISTGWPWWRMTWPTVRSQAKVSTVGGTVSPRRGVRKSPISSGCPSVVGSDVVGDGGLLSVSSLSESSSNMSSSSLSLFMASSISHSSSDFISGSFFLSLYFVSSIFMVSPPLPILLTFGVLRFKMMALKILFGDCVERWRLLVNTSSYKEYRKKRLESKGR